MDRANIETLLLYIEEYVKNQRFLKTLLYTAVISCLNWSLKKANTHTILKLRHLDRTKHFFYMRQNCYWVILVSS